MKRILENHMTIVFPSRDTNVSSAVDASSTFIKQLDPISDDLNDIKTAIKEAVSNAVIYAYPDEIGKISIRIAIFNDNLLEIKVRDWGCGIKNVEEAITPLFTTGGDECSGLGFTVMDSFMDKVTVRSTLYKGTTVTMCKKITPKEMRY